MVAATLRDEELVKLLLINGADVTLQDKSGRTAADIAKKKRNQKVISLLSDGS
jgi:ankyrin repeat protein